MPALCDPDDTAMELIHVRLLQTIYTNSHCRFCQILNILPVSARTCSVSARLLNAVRSVKNNRHP